MNTFYAAFIPGLQNIVEDVVKKRLPDVKIRKLLDGAIIFETQTSYDKLNFFCFNNIFAVINVIERNHAKSSSRQEYEENNFERDIKSLLNENCDNDVITNNSKSFKTFRIVISNENKPVAINEKLRVEAEKYISRLSGLKTDRSLPDTEFWFLQRSENFSVFMKRLTLRSSWDKTLHKGELPPPLAWTLCFLASLKHSDTVLDPFCGYGSIPESAIKHFHITNFTACDINSEAILYTTAKFKNKFGFVLHKSDFSELPKILQEKSIDVIITDPPWGEYDKGKSDRIGNNSFYVKMFAIFEKLLKKEGRAVVLCSENVDFLELIPNCLKLQNKIPILLSGKKAVIYILVSM